MLSPSDTQTILVVDDTPANITLLVGLLSGNYKIKVAINRAKALKIAFTELHPTLILLDIIMSYGEGLGIILEVWGTHFDPEIIDAFKEVQDTVARIAATFSGKPTLQPETPAKGIKHAYYQENSVRG